MESIRHAGAANGADVHIELINSEEVTPETSEKLLGKVDGIVIVIMNSLSLAKASLKSVQYSPLYS